jgi:hypothetical protein
MVLEVLGGIMVLLLINGLQNKWLKYAFIIPFFVFLVIQNKKIINMSLAYDISFRPGYYYNRNTYFERKNSLFINKIDIQNENKFKPIIYINCSVQGMTYNPLSEFNNLPVLNIDRRAYKSMSTDDDYRNKNKERLDKFLYEKEFKENTIPFVSITTFKGLGVEYENCINHIESEGYEIIDEEEVDFIGNKDVVLRVIYGEIDTNSF